VNTYILLKTIRYISLLLTVFFIIISQTTAQSGEEGGKISGKILDAKTGETIIGANVRIEESSRGAATDVNGDFTISDLEPGTYNIRISYVSYAQKTITGVKVAAGSATTVNTSLQSSSKQLDEVVVTASVNRNSEAGLLSVQRRATSVQDGLSSEQISKQGDSDVGAAIKRVTGVTVQNGQDVFVRGLGNRYSNVQLNGSQLPSTNPNKKEAPIDLFGSSLISNILVQKTYTADQSAEFSGGSVQITTREFPDERNLSISYSTEYNSVSSFDNTLSGFESSTDFLGYDDGKRSLPSFLNNQRVSDENSVQAVQELHNSWNVNRNESAIPSQKISVNYANQFNEDKMPIGVSSNISYKYTRDLEPNKEQRSILSFTDSGPLYYSDYEQDVGRLKADLSGMINIFAKPSSVTKVGLKTLYSNSTTNSKSVLQGPFQNGTTRLTYQDFDKRTIFSTTLEAETYFENFMSSTLSGKVSYNLAMRNRPDRRTTRYNQVGDEFTFAPFGDSNGHFFSEQEDNNYSGEIKYEFKPNEFLNVSAGGTSIIKDRSFTARRLSYRDQVAPFVNGSTESASPDVILADEMVSNGTLELVETTQFGLNQSDWYDGYQTIYAGFLSTKWSVSDKFSFELGGRVEESTQTIEVPQNLSGEYVEASEVSNTDFLPAFNATYEVSEDINIRGAFSRTLARPEFREISNFNFADFFGGRRVYGNPDLERTRITNYDLRFETYPSGGELFAVSFFYKNFENPIELFYRFTENNEVFYNNAKEADLYGVEVEGRKNITEQLQLVANASYIYSETRLNQEDVNRVANINRPMVGQSPFTVNVSSFYTIPEWNMNLSLSYNTFGERIVTVGKNSQNFDEYEQPFHDLSAKIDYNIGQLALSFEAGNLLNDIRQYQQGPITTFEYSPGVTLQLGATLSL
jgi:outer membrane receptor protein involved in Fe transport